MHQNSDSVVYEIKIIMKADGTRSIQSRDSNGNGMNLLNVREAMTWAKQKIDDEVMLAMINAGILEKQRNGGIIKPEVTLPGK